MEKTLSPIAVIGLGFGIVVLGAALIFREHIQHQVLLATIASGAESQNNVLFLDTNETQKIEFDPTKCVCPYCCKAPEA